MGHQSFSEKSQTRQVLQLVFDHLNAGANVSLTQANGILTITSTGGGGGIATIVPGDGIDVDATDPINPIVSALLSSDVGNAISFGVDSGLFVPTPAALQSDTGIVATGGGLLGAVIDPSLISAQIRGICTGTYDYSTASNWQMWVSPTPASGTFTLDVQKRTWGNTAPAPGDSVCAAAYPTLAGNGTDFTATGATSTWTGSIVRGDMLTVVPTLNTAGVKWWALYIPARRTF